MLKCDSCFHMLSKLANFLEYSAFTWFHFYEAVHETSRTSDDNHVRQSANQTIRKQWPVYDHIVQLFACHGAWLYVNVADNVYFSNQTYSLYTTSNPTTSSKSEMQNETESMASLPTKLSTVCMSAYTKSSR